MNIALTISRNTSNDLASLLRLPFHYVLGLYNTLMKALEEENKKRNGEGESSPSLSGFKMPSSMSFAGPGGTSSIHLG